MNDLSPSSSSASGYFWIILTAFFWSLVGVLSKVCMAEGVTPLETAFWRAAFGLLFFPGHTLFTRQIAVPPRVAANFILFGVWGIGVFYSVTQYAIKLSGAAMAVVLMYTAPIWVPSYRASSLARPSPDASWAPSAWPCAARRWSAFPAAACRGSTPGWASPAASSSA